MADEEQGELIPGLRDQLGAARGVAAEATARTKASEQKRPAVDPAEVDPVARVVVDVPLAHLDRPFDYLVPAKLADTVVPGARVKVRFAGQDVDGFVLERVAESEHPGRLAPIRRAVSTEPVLSPEIAELSAQVAARYAGTRSDVLRLAVPPRHATVEKQDTPDPGPWPGSVGAAEAAAGWWGRYERGAALVAGLGAVEGAPRAVWTALPGEDWTRGLAHLAAATLAAGRGSVLCVPDVRDLARLDAALTEVLGDGRHVLLTADVGPAARYRAFLSVSRGAVQVVAGTRAAAFAPVRDLGLVAVWDDGDDLYAEPRAPYPHIREVLLLRSHATGCGAVVGGTARSVEAASLVRTGWAESVEAARTVVREAAPTVAVTGATDRELERDPTTRWARLPHSAHVAIREALELGPVLVQTPRAGYATSLVCDTCREPARCRVCSGPLQQTRPHLPPTCRWCGSGEQERACAVCGSRGLRAPVLGDRRTAEELGRAFPSVPVKRSSRDRVLDEVDASPALVVATPGAEPPAVDGYAGVVLLDTWLLLARADLRASEEAVRRWLNAATLARPGARGGRVVAVGDPARPELQALVRWDPAGFATRELDDRAEAHLPPGSRLAVLTGPEDAVTAAGAALALPPGAELLGPVPATDDRPRAEGTDEVEEQVRLVVRVPRAAGGALSRALVEMQGVRSAKKLAPVRVQVDPYALG